MSTPSPFRFVLCVDACKNFCVIGYAGPVIAFSDKNVLQLLTYLPSLILECLMDECGNGHQA